MDVEKEENVIECNYLSMKICLLDIYETYACF